MDDEELVFAIGSFGAVAGAVLTYAGEIPVTKTSQTALFAVLAIFWIFESIDF